MIIEVRVEKRNATLTTPKKIVCRNGGYKMRFEFDEEWEEQEEKTARFVVNGVFEEVPIVDNECEIPPIEDAKKVVVGVCGPDDMATNGVEIKCEKSIRCIGKPNTVTFTLIDFINGTLNLTEKKGVTWNEIFNAPENVEWVGNGWTYVTGLYADDPAAYLTFQGREVTRDGVNPVKNEPCPVDGATYTVLNA